MTVRRIGPPVQPPESTAPETPLPCPEPGCEGTLRRKWSNRFGGWFYGCDTWADTKCSGAVGCDEDGAMHGIPADAVTRKARRMVHARFELLWRRGYMTEDEARAALGAVFGVERLSVSQLDLGGCRKLWRTVNALGRVLDEYEEAS